MSGALEVYGAVGVSIVARSSPHMQRRHPPSVPNQTTGIYLLCCVCVCVHACVRACVCITCLLSIVHDVQMIPLHYC